MEEIGNQVYDALTPSLPQIFSSGAISVQIFGLLDDWGCEAKIGRNDERSRVHQF
jgi:hypothetical protein